MRIIPVMDLKGGEVVHAVGGRRNEYRPIRSQLVESSSPETVARAFRDQLKLNELYVADLDAIAGAEPAWNTYRALCDLGLQIMVDAGLRDKATARALREVGVSGIVIGLESVTARSFVRELADEIGPTSVWFSLDLKNGTPLVRPGVWPEATAQAIAAEVMSLGITRLIVLDLARVGERRGTGTGSLCRRLLAQHPGLELLVGGGIRDRTDLDRLERAGVAGALVATALHELRIP